MVQYSLGEVAYLEVLFFNYSGSGVGSNLLSEICPHFQESLADTVEPGDFNIIRDKSDYIISNHC